MSANQNEKLSSDHYYCVNRFGYIVFAFLHSLCNAQPGSARWMSKTPKREEYALYSCSDAIEQSYRAKLPSHEVFIQGTPFTIVFQAMKQYNREGGSRHVQRIESPGIPDLVWTLCALLDTDVELTIPGQWYMVVPGYPRGLRPLRFMEISCGSTWSVCHGVTENAWREKHSRVERKHLMNEGLSLPAATFQLEKAPQFVRILPGTTPLVPKAPWYGAHFHNFKCNLISQKTSDNQKEGVPVDLPAEVIKQILTYRQPQSLQAAGSLPALPNFPFSFFCNPIPHNLCETTLTFVDQCTITLSYREDFPGEYTRKGTFEILQHPCSWRENISKLVIRWYEEDGSVLKRPFPSEGEIWGDFSAVNIFLIHSAVMMRKEEL